MRTKLAVNGEFNLLCWSIGRDILDRQHNRPKAGEEVIERLAKDFGVAFLGSKASIRRTQIFEALLRRGRKRNLCDRLLHICRGARLLNRIKDPPGRNT